MQRLTGTTLSRWEAVGCDMENVVVPIVVALITGPLVVLMHKLRKENTNQHNEARLLMRILARKVDKVSDKIDAHIDWHMNRKDDNG